MRYLNKFLLTTSVLFLLACNALCEEKSINTLNQVSNSSFFGREFNQEKALGLNKYFEYASVNESIRLKSVKYRSDEFARIYIKDRMALFHSVFDVKRVDYPGQYSKTITCPDEFKPKLFEIDLEGGYLVYYSGFANKNKITGACVADLLEYKYSYGFIFCSSKRELFEFEHYSPLASNLFDSFRNHLVCN
jgi:hypothetical protein